MVEVKRGKNRSRMTAIGRYVYVEVCVNCATSFSRVSIYKGQYFK